MICPYGRNYEMAHKHLNLGKQCFVSFNRHDTQVRQELVYPFTQRSRTKGVKKLGQGHMVLKR